MEIQEWKHNKTTVEVFKRVEARFKDVHSELPHYIPTDINQTALRNAHSKGVLDGLRTLTEIYNDMGGQDD